MRKTPTLQRFDAAVRAFISSRRALGRAIRLDEYVLRRLRSYLARAGYPDLDGPSFARWRRRLRHCAHNTQLDWTMMGLSVPQVSPAPREPMLLASEMDAWAAPPVFVTDADQRWSGAAASGLRRRLSADRGSPAGTQCPPPCDRIVVHGGSSSWRGGPTADGGR